MLHKQQKNTMPHGADGRTEMMDYKQIKAIADAAGIELTVKGAKTLAHFSSIPDTSLLESHRAACAGKRTYGFIDPLDAILCAVSLKHDGFSVRIGELHSWGTLAVFVRDADGNDSRCVRAYNKDVEAKIRAAKKRAAKKSAAR